MNQNERILIEVIGEWNRYIGKAFKCNLIEGMSPPMHFLLTQIETPVSMSDLARKMRMPKQQMTRLADRVIELGMAERVNDANDRRVVLLKATEKAGAYMEECRDRMREHLHKMLEDMGEKDEQKFLSALESIHEVFMNIDRREREKKGN